MNSYLSSSRSSTIESFVIFAGGSASSSCGTGQQWRESRQVGLTHALGFGPRTPLDVERELVARLCRVYVCVLSLQRGTSAIKAGETDVDAQWAVL